MQEEEEENRVKNGKASFFHDFLWPVPGCQWPSQGVFFSIEAPKHMQMIAHTHTPAQLVHFERKTKKKTNDFYRKVFIFLTRIAWLIEDNNNNNRAER